METTSASSEARELSLVGKVEMRIALADSDGKLQTILGTFLPPLLLKLGSEHVTVRNKVISICQHVNTRTKPESVKLPVAALVEQFKAYPHTPLIRHFDLLYIQQGIRRMSASESAALFPTILQGLAATTKASATHGSQMFNFLLQVVRYFQLPDRGSKEDDELRLTLKLSDEDANFLAHWFGKLILLTPVKANNSGVSANNVACPGLTPEEYTFLTQNKEDTWSHSSTGLNLFETKVRVAKLLASGAFKDAERFLPALFASADPASAISGAGEDILKRARANISLEDVDLIRTLLQYYFGDDTPNGLMRVRMSLRFKILGLLEKSTLSTTFTEEIIKLVHDGIIHGPDDNNAVLRPDYSSAPSTSGREALKLRAAVFQYINFAARYGDQKSLHKIAPRVLGRLREYIEGQGWPKPASNEDLVSRGLAYEVIGLLAKAGPREMVVEPNLDILRWLFESLAFETPASSVNVSVEEALSTVIGTVAKGVDSKTAPHLESLLLDQMEKSGIRDDASPVARRSTRYAAVRFANRCLPYTSIKARWIDILAIAAGKEDRQEVSEEGSRGLSPYWFRMLNGANDASAQEPNMVFPSFVDLMDFAFHQTSISSAASRRAPPEAAVERLHQQYPHAFLAVIKYCRHVFLHEALHESQSQVKLDADWEIKLDAVVANDEAVRSAVKQSIAGIVSQKSTTSSAFELLLLAFSTSLITKDESRLGDSDSDKLFIDLCALSPGSVVAIVAPYYKDLSTAIYSNKPTKRQAAAHAFGLLASHPLVQDTNADDVQEAVKQLITKVSAWRDAVGGMMNQVHGAIAALGYFFSRLALRSGRKGIPETMFKEYLELIISISTSSTDGFLKIAACSAISELCMFQVLTPADFGAGDQLKTVIDRTADIAKSGNERAALALGQIAMILEEPDSESPTEEVDSLLLHVEKRVHQLHELRQVEAHFSVGEAISYIAVGWESKSLATKMDIDCPAPQGPARVYTLKRTLEKILRDCRNTKPSLRKASVLWLLCMVQFCGHLQEVHSQLPACQSAFKSCLVDRDEFIQETASRGLGLVYEKGDRNLKDDLVRDLIGSFSDSKTQLAGSVSAETQLFEPGALPTGDGSVTTYKDIMSLASEVGDSSLVYKFMSLASSNAIWSSRAAFGRFGLSNVLSDSSIDGFLANNPKLYPKLYRYRFDPNSSVQRSMNDIWNALVKDSSATIDAHFDTIMEDLLQNILGKEWRVRQACCAAIADLVQGRPLERYERYLERIWAMCFKVLDDIKESVRAAAASLARVMTGVLTRALEADTAASKNATAMLKHVLPFLLSTSGIESSATEVQTFALHTLLEIIKKSSGKTLRPFIPELVERLLDLLTALEPAMVNYLHLNAKQYNLTEQKIDDMRLMSIRSGPLMEAIERCLDLLDDPTMQQLQPHLESAMKSAVGLPSKVGCSRILVSLSTRHNALFRPYSDVFLRLIEKHVLDRNDTVSSSYAAAAGYVARGASDKNILHIVDFSKKLYFESKDDRDQVVPRKSVAAAELLQGISKHASDRFNALAASILPFVFIAKHDSHDQVKNIFQETWNDNVSGSRTVSLYLREIVSMAVDHLDSPQWAVKHTAARSIADATVAVASLSSDMDLTNARILWPALEKALAGKTWDGKEVLLYALVKFTETNQKLWTAQQEVAQGIEKIAIREAKRQNARYRPHALKCLGKIASTRTDINMFDTVYDIVAPVIADLLAIAKEDKMEVDRGDDERTEKEMVEQTAANAVEALREISAADANRRSEASEHEENIFVGWERAVLLIHEIQPMRKEYRSLNSAVESFLAAAVDRLNQAGAGKHPKMRRMVEDLQ